jgi:hypothetical protein
MQRLLDAAAAADMLAWENSGFSVDASVRITLIDRDVPSYFQSLEHLPERVNDFETPAEQNYCRVVVRVCGLAADSRVG